MEPLPKIHIITDTKTAGENFFDIIQALINHGLTFIQLREKHLTPREQYQIGKKIKEMAKNKNLKLTINDRLDLALALNAYAVQLTQNSLDPEIIKKHAKNIKIGLSVHDLEPIKKHQQTVDYFIFGNIYQTKTHPEQPAKGLQAIKQLTKATTVPVYAIGGITPQNMHEPLQAGAYGVAMKGAFFGTPDYLHNIQQTIKKIGEP